MRTHALFYNAKTNEIFVDTVFSFWFCKEESHVIRLEFCNEEDYQGGE